MSCITTDINRALIDLQSGKPVAIPTETVYGLAARIDNEQAMRAVFSMKNRPLNHPLIVHIAHNADLSAFVDYIPDYAQQLINHYWPGPLTLVLKTKPNCLHPLITGGQPTVAIRSPAHPVAQALLQALKVPLVAPSANPFGKISPTTAEHILQAFPHENLTILEGGRCTIGIESTILDATNPDSYQILRAGVITEQDLAKVIPTACHKVKNDLRVPGKLDRHYQPEKTLYYFKNQENLEIFCQKHYQKTYVLATQRPANVSENYFYCLSDSAKQTAFELYYQLRKADLSSADYIALLLPTTTYEWEGVRERIFKAGEPGD